MSNTVEPTPSQTPGSNPSSPMIHPIIVFPYVCPEDFSDLEALYTWVEGLALDEDTYARPITVIDRKTHHADTIFDAAKGIEEFAFEENRGRQAFCDAIEAHERGATDGFDDIIIKFAHRSCLS